MGIKPAQTLDMSADELLAALCRAFHPTAAERRLWRDDLDFLYGIDPPPSRYVRWHFRRLADTLHHAVLREAPPGGRILDLGAGPYSLALLRHRYHGTVDYTDRDPQPTTLRLPGGEVLNSAPRRYHLAPGEPPPEREAYDLVIFTEMIEHMKFDPAEALEVIRQSLKPGGKLVLTTPNLTAWKKIWRLMLGGHPYDSILVTGDPGPWEHAREYSPTELRGLLRAGGYAVQRMETRDVYFDDRTLRDQVAKYLTAGVLTAVLRYRDAGRILLRGGSTTFIVAQRLPEPAPVPPEPILVPQA